MNKVQELMRHALGAYCSYGKEEPYIIGDAKLSTKRQKRKFFNEAVQCFLLSKKSPVMLDPLGKKQEKIQAFTGSSSIPSVTDEGVWTTTIQERQYDLAWQLAFRTVELSRLANGNKNRFWRIATGKKGFRMNKIPEGGKVQIGGFSGESEIVGVERYGMGFGITWETRNDQDFNAFTDALLSTQAELYGTWADVHYALLAAAADTTGSVAWQGSGDNLERDTQTINKAVEDIATLNKNKGYGDVAKRQLLLYYPIAMDARMQRVMKALLTDDRKSIMPYNVRMIMTLNDNLLRSGGTSQEAVIVLPGEKIQNALHTQELGMSEKDIESDNQINVTWTAFGATVADTDQCKRVLFHA